MSLSQSYFVTEWGFEQDGSGDSKIFFDCFSRPIGVSRFVFSLSQSVVVDPMTAIQILYAQGWSLLCKWTTDCYMSGKCMLEIFLKLAIDHSRTHLSSCLPMGPESYQSCWLSMKSSMKICSRGSWVACSRQIGHCSEFWAAFFKKRMAPLLLPVINVGPLALMILSLSHSCVSDLNANYF